MFYCSSVWTSTPKKNIARLQKVQNFAARVATGTRKFDHITPTLKQLHWLPVAWQLEVRDAVMAYKCLHGQAPAYLRSKFIVRADVHSINTRHRNKLDVPLFKIATGQQSFIFRATRLWNELPRTLTDVNSLSIFKDAIKRRAWKNFIET
ncbi:hypothetical protein ACROYT_G011045 [Oculina patagonica]